MPGTTLSQRNTRNWPDNTGLRHLDSPSNTCIRPNWFLRFKEMRHRILCHENSSSPVSVHECRLNSNRPIRNYSIQILESIRLAIYVIGRLRVGPYREKLWPRVWKCLKKLNSERLIVRLGWTVIYFPILRQARPNFFRECLQLRKDVTI